MSEPTFRHGTLNGYVSHKCRCDECGEVGRSYFRAYRKLKKQAPVPETAHGTVNGYRLYACRCGECRAAHAAAQRSCRDRKRAEASS